MVQPFKHEPWDVFNPFHSGGKYEIYHLTSHRIVTPEFHCHDFFELFFYLSGNASMVIEQYTYRMRPGDVFLLPPGRMHRAVHPPTQTYYDRFFIYVSRDTLRQISTPEYPILSFIEKAAEESHLCGHPSEREFSQALAQMNDIILSAAGADAEQRLINDCQFTILLARMCKWFTSQLDAGVSSTPRVLAQVIAYINANLEKDLSLDVLSRQFFINKYHLLRAFKAYAQTTLYQYILQKRITRAKDLLRAGTPPVLVCAQSGFNDYSSFYKAFKKQTLLSPQQYIELTGLRAPTRGAFCPQPREEP